MSTAVIYKINRTGYLMHSDRTTVSGFRIASEPFIHISEDANVDVIGEAIKLCLNKKKDTQIVPDPNSWKDFDKEFLRKARLKSLKELYHHSTICCEVEKREDNIIFTTTQHADKPANGFVKTNKSETISIPFTASNKDVVQSFELAISKCNKF